MDRTYIDAQTTVQGSLEGNYLEVAGRVQGQLIGQVVHVAASGQVEGGITADDVHVSGTVEGPIRAARVQVANEGQALGGIQAPSISLADGCTIHGRLDSRPPETAAPPAHRTAPTPSWVPRAVPIPVQSHEETTKSQMPSEATPRRQRRAPRKPPRAPDLSHMTLTPGDSDER